MAAKRPGMILYHDKYEALSALDDHDFRRVIDALMHTSMTGEPVTLEGYVGVIYSLMASKLHDDIAKYERTVEARREAGRRSGEVRRTKGTNVDFVEQNEQTKTLSQTVSQTETQSKTKTLTENLSSLQTSPQGQGNGEKMERFPTVEEIVEYGKEAGYERVDEAAARSFIGQQAARGWKDSNGNDIRDWRSWFSGWYTRNVLSSVRPITSMQYDQRTYTDEELRALTAFMEDDDES